MILNVSNVWGEVTLLLNVQLKGTCWLEIERLLVNPFQNLLLKVREEYDEEFAVEGDLFMVRSLLGNLSMENERSQRENIFHIQCLIQDKVFFLDY